MDLEEKVEVALSELVDEMRNLDPESDVYANCVKAYAELSKARTDYYKVQTEDWNKRSEIEAKQAEVDAKQSEVAAGVLRSKLEAGSKAFTAIVSGGLTIWGICRLTKFEDEVASVTSKAMSFIPKMKFW